MSFFIALFVIGLAGLVFLAIPAFGHHGHAGHSGHGTQLGHGGHTASHAGHTAPATHTHGTAHHGENQTQSASATSGLWLGLMPSPRTLFSLLTLYGAAGNLLEKFFHLPYFVAVLGAILPAYLIERWLMTPLWQLLTKFTAVPISPLDTLLFQEAEAVSHFKNGKGIVKMEHDGREVQFLAELIPEQQALSIGVGDRLRVEEVDSTKEKVTVRIG